MLVTRKSLATAITAIAIVMTRGNIATAQVSVNVEGSPYGATAPLINAIPNNEGYAAKYSVYGIHPGLNFGNETGLDFHVGLGVYGLRSINVSNVNQVCLNGTSSCFTSGTSYTGSSILLGPEAGINVPVVRRKDRWSLGFGARFGIGIPTGQITIVDNGVTASFVGTKLVYTQAPATTMSVSASTELNHIWHHSFLPTFWVGPKFRVAIPRKNYLMIGVGVGVPDGVSVVIGDSYKLFGKQK